MNPEVRVTIDGGCVVDATATVPGMGVLIYDMDAERSGEDPRTTLAVGLEEDIDPAPFGPISDEEKARFDAELVGNINGNATADVLIGIIDTVPQARAAFRAWLAEAEAETRAAEQEGDGEDDLSDPYQSAV
jgi:hypothetical protein